MVVADEAILTLAVTVGVTTMVSALEVVGLPVTQLAFEVITHVTVFPFASVVLVYVEALVPTFVPFTFHWKLGVAPPLLGVAVKVTLAP